MSFISRVFRAFGAKERRRCECSHPYCFHFEYVKSCNVLDCGCVNYSPKQDPN